MQVTCYAFSYPFQLTEPVLVTAQKGYEEYSVQQNSTHKHAYDHL